MKIIFMGTPDFAVNVLDKLINEKHNILSVYTQPDSPKGRGHKLLPSPVKEYSMCKGITIYTPKTLKSEQIIEEIKSYKPDMIIVAAYGKILPKEILDIPKYGCINVHASLLPNYRGAAPIQRAVINGEKETGVTIMRMNDGLDTGDIISMRKIDITENDTSGTMFQKLSALGAELLIEAINDVFSGKVKYIPQEDSKATYASMITKQMTNIDWSKSSTEIRNLVRGLAPFYIAKTSYNGCILKLHETKCCFGQGNPGEVIENNNKLVVACGNGTALELLTVQGENGKIMPASDYLRGHNIEKGTIFE